MGEGVLGRLDEAGLAALAARMAGCLEPPLTIHLEGDLGAGKTTFARALIRALGHEGAVKSPTYGLLEHYPLARCTVLHLDLYRIADTGELEFLGIEDLLGDDTVLLVEWPERGEGALPRADLVLSLAGAGAEREFTMRACSAAGRVLVSELTNPSDKSVSS
jgi:tRNA threonylcarbamoyladenosine biosynthesis protein TsaE